MSSEPTRGKAAGKAAIYSWFSSFPRSNRVKKKLWRQEKPGEMRLDSRSSHGSGRSVLLFLPLLSLLLLEIVVVLVILVWHLELLILLDISKIIHNSTTHGLMKS